MIWILFIITSCSLLTEFKITNFEIYYYGNCRALSEGAKVAHDWNISLSMSRNGSKCTGQVQKWDKLCSTLQFMHHNFQLSLFFISLLRILILTCYQDIWLKISIEKFQNNKILDSWLLDFSQSRNGLICLTPYPRIHMFFAKLSLGWG